MPDHGQAPFQTACRERLIMPSGPLSRDHMRHTKLTLIALLIALIAAMGSVQIGLAHPLGNFTINRYSRIELANEQIRLRYVVDMAEIPTYQEMQLIERNHDGQVDEAERTSYLQQKVPQLRQGLNLQVNGKSVALNLVLQDLSFPPGQGGLPTLRLVSDWSTPFTPTQGPQQLDYRDDNFADRLGWKEIVIRADHVKLIRSSVPATDLSAELTKYPDDMLSSPLNQREAHATFELTAASASAPAGDLGPVTPRPNVLDRSRDQLAALIATQELSLPIILVSLVVAFGLGALHSLSPGHGKTIVGAYLVGSRGTARHAIFLGLTVTLTHTIGVFALGLVTLFASQFILPEQLYPWLSVISGVLVVLIGMSLFATRLRSFLAHRSEPEHAHAHDHHHTQGAHDHAHAHGHSHLPLDAQGNVIDALSWRNLLALGISGGLLPCPSALVVLLSAIALQRVAFGLVLIVAFSAGLAGVLTGIGLLLVYANHLFARLQAPGQLARLIPVGSALVVTALGIVILAEALVQVGVLRL